MQIPNQVAGHRLYAGVAKRDITISSPNVRVNDPLYAKALVLSDGSTSCAIVTMDVTSIGGRTISDSILFDVADEFMPNLRRRVEAELDIPGCNIMVTASHTHPYHGRLLCDDNEQIERALDALRQAARGMVPVRVGTGVGYEDRLTVNRTLRLKNGKHWCVRMGNPCPPDEDVAGVGPIDPRIGLIRVDRMDGHPLAVVYNFGCHQLLGVPRGGATADFSGFASKVIESHLGNDAMALFIQGTVGDLAEIHNKDINRPKNSEDNGTVLGLTIVDALKDISAGDVSLNMISKTVLFPRKTDYAEQIAALQREKGTLADSFIASSLNFKSFLPLYLKHMISPEYPSDYSYRYLQAEKIGNTDLLAMDAQNRKEIDRYLQHIRSMEKLVRINNNLMTLRKHEAMCAASGGEDVPAEIQGLKLGDFVLITSPTEVHVEVGQKIKKMSPYEKTFIASITNGYLHYSPPVSYYGKGGYEVTECILEPGWEQVFEDTVREIINGL